MERERQIWESVAIDRLSSHSPNTCLNLKSEWGHSRTPALVNKDNNKVRKRPELEKKGRRVRDKEPDPDNEELEEGREGRRKRFKQDDEAGEEKEYQEGKEASQSGAEEGRPSTPVVTKIERWNKRIREEIERGEAGVRTPRSRPGKRERPKGKEKMMQPTLSSFLSLRSGFKGSGGKRARQVSPSHESHQDVTGQGPPTGPNTGGQTYRM